MGADQLNTNGCCFLVGEIIKQSLKDFYSKDKNKKIEAKLFFEKSPLFKATGLDFEYLKRKYQKSKLNKNYYVKVKKMAKIRKNKSRYHF